MDYVNYDVPSVGKAIHSLKNLGVAVLPNQFTRGECSNYRDAIWQGIHHITQGRFDINHPSTWKEFGKFQPKKAMVLQSWVGHLQPDNTRMFLKHLRHCGIQGPTTY